MIVRHLPTPTTMHWYARPEGDTKQLSVVPRLASWNKSDHPDQVRLREYLDGAQDLLVESRIDEPWALRLDVGLPAGRSLLDMADLDNYAYPLASRVKDDNLVSVWCTKQRADHSFMRIEAARITSPPQVEVLTVRTTASAEKPAFKQQIRDAVAAAQRLPDGPVSLELSYVVGPRRNWMNLWKPTIDALDPLLGRVHEGRDWHPQDGRITELGLHVKVDGSMGYDVDIAIVAREGPPGR